MVLFSILLIFQQSRIERIEVPETIRINRMYSEDLLFLFLSELGSDIFLILIFVRKNINHCFSNLIRIPTILAVLAFIVYVPPDILFLY